MPNKSYKPKVGEIVVHPETGTIAKVDLVEGEEVRLAQITPITGWVKASSVIPMGEPTPETKTEPEPPPAK